MDTYLRKLEVKIESRESILSVTLNFDESQSGEWAFHDWEPDGGHLAYGRIVKDARGKAFEIILDTDVDVFSREAYNLTSDEPFPKARGLLSALKELMDHFDVDETRADLYVE